MPLPANFAAARDFAASSQAIADGDRETILSALKVLVSVLAIVGVLAAAISSGGSAKEEDGSSKPDDEPSYTYEEPDPKAQMWLEDLGRSLETRVQEVRKDKGIEGIIIPDVTRKERAQAKAEYNAATGTHNDARENVGQLQAALPIRPQGGAPAASADAFMQLWLSSDEHKEVLIDGKYLQLGVGTAYANGSVYVVLQFNDGFSARSVLDSES